MICNHANCDEKCQTCGHSVPHQDYPAPALSYRSGYVACDMPGLCLLGMSEDHTMARNWIIVTCVEEVKKCTA